MAWESFIQKIFKLLILLLLIAQVFLFPHWGVAGSTEQSSQLIIGTKHVPPFAYKDNDGLWRGISIELWRQIASDMNLEYRFEQRDLKGLLEGVEDSSLDASVAALTITAEREKRFDFSHPFYHAGLGIAVIKERDRNLWIPVLNRFFSIGFLKIILTLTLLLFFTGLLIWFFEKDKNGEQFGGSVISGIGSGFWWSAVTMTTVGYGDKAPKTVVGRLVGLIWMFVAVIVISSFTAGITSTLTVNQIQTLIRGPQDLHKVSVGSLSHTTSADWLEQRQIVFRSFSSAKDALTALSAGEIDAVVYDAPILRHLVLKNFQTQVFVMESEFEKQQYGIGLPSDSPLRERINQLIPEIINSGEWHKLLFRYMGF